MGREKAVLDGLTGDLSAAADVERDTLRQGLSLLGRRITATDLALPPTPEGTPMILRTADSNEELPDTVTLHDYESLCRLVDRSFQVSERPGEWFDLTRDYMNVIAIPRRYYLVRPAPPKPIQVEIPRELAELLASAYRGSTWVGPGVKDAIDTIIAAYDAAAGGEGS